ncbi:MAG: pilus assembly protein [Proteobacteria bacterium]|nr:pilus assembly protein [Pseudomonadota bacterium]
MSNLKAGNRRQTGQGMVEYIIIVALVGIGAAGVFGAFGSTVQSQMAGITNGLAGKGDNARKAVKIAGLHAQIATIDAELKLGMDDYDFGVTQKK